MPVEGRLYGLPERPQPTAAASLAFCLPFRGPREETNRARRNGRQGRSRGAPRRCGARSPYARIRAAHHRICCQTTGCARWRWRLRLDPHRRASPFVRNGAAHDAAQYRAACACACAAPSPRHGLFGDTHGRRVFLWVIVGIDRKAIIPPLRAWSSRWL